MTNQEILTALNNGKNVYWSNTAYKVFLQFGTLYTINIYNDSMCGLQESEYKDCFIEENNSVNN